MTSRVLLLLLQLTSRCHIKFFSMQNSPTPVMQRLHKLFWAILFYFRNMFNPGFDSNGDENVNNAGFKI